MANIGIFLERQGSFLCPKTVSAIRTGRVMASSWGASLYGIAVVQDSVQLSELLEIAGKEGVDKVIGILSPMMSMEETTGPSLLPLLLPVLTEYTFAVLLFGAGTGTYELASSLALLRDSYFVPNVSLEEQDGLVSMVHRIPASDRLVRWNPRTLERFVVGLVHAPPYSGSRGNPEDVEVVATRSNSAFRMSWLHMKTRDSMEDASFFVLAGSRVAEDTLLRLEKWCDTTDVPLFFAEGTKGFPATSKWGTLSHTSIPLTASGVMLVGMESQELEACLPCLNFIHNALLVDSLLPQGVLFPAIREWEGDIESFVEHLLSEYAL